MMLTIRSFVSPVLPRRLSMTTVPRLLITFTQNVLKTSATSFQGKIVSFLWIRVILLQSLKLLFAGKGFTVFQKKFIISDIFSV